MAEGAPTLVRRQLGRRLRRLREQSGKTIKDVERSKLFSQSKVIRIESGRAEVKIGDVWALCRFYGVTDDAVVDSLTSLAEGTGQRAWWETSESRGVTGQFALFLGLEEGADEILMWEPEVVPGLLQTPEYASAVDTAYLKDETDFDKPTQLRLDRQKRFFSRKPSGHISAIIGQGALTREVGGPLIRDQQLDHLGQLAHRPGVEVRVLPWSAGAHPGMTGGFTIFDFRADEDPSVVFLDSIGVGSYLEEGRQLVSYRAVFDRLQQLAIPLEEFRP